jgi:hypothetical protein
MKIMERIKFYLLGFAVASMDCSGCRSNNDTSGTSRISVRMMDAPADYDGECRKYWMF